MYYKIDRPSTTKLPEIMFELKRALSFIGPGFLVAIGYLDPGIQIQSKT